MYAIGSSFFSKPVFALLRTMQKNEYIFRAKRVGHPFLLATKKISEHGLVTVLYCTVLPHALIGRAAHHARGRVSPYASTHKKLSTDKVEYSII